MFTSLNLLTGFHHLECCVFYNHRRIPVQIINVIPSQIVGDKANYMYIIKSTTTDCVYTLKHLYVQHMILRDTIRH